MEDNKEMNPTPSTEGEENQPEFDTPANPAPAETPAEPEAPAEEESAGNSEEGGEEAAPEEEPKTAETTSEDKTSGCC